MTRKLKHEQALRLVSRRLDAELEPLDEAMLAAHLNTCDACQSSTQDLSVLSRLMRAEQPVQAPAGLVARAIQFHGGKVRREREAESMIRWGAVAAGLVMLVTSFFAFGGPTGGLHRDELQAANESLLDRVLVSERRQPHSGVEILWQKLANGGGRIR
jgi:predicted anti-sigma-YlaC factor YlaD